MATNKLTNFKKSLKKFFENDLLLDSVLTIVIFAVMILIISNPNRYTSGTVEGLKLFFYKVFPGLFPFMLLTKLLTELGVLFKVTGKFDGVSRKVFGTPGISLYAFLMSIISGYPIGAKIISDLYQKGMITEEDARKMSVFCTTSGPIFVFGTVGAFMFKNYTFGVVLYVSHILSSIVLGILYHLISSRKKNENTIHYAPVIEFKKRQNIMAECINSTINSLFVVGAYITLFYLLTELLESLKVFDFIINILAGLGAKSDHSKGIIYGILEVTRGAQELSFVGGPIALVLTSAVLSFSGLSIIMQSMAFLKDAKIKAHKFILTKILHALLSALLCYILILIFL